MVCAAPVLALLAAACTTIRETFPPRTGTEQLLMSTAIDRAVEELRLDIPPGTKVFVDPAHIEGTDSKYAIGTVRERLLKRGARLAPDRGQADVVVEIRAGALATDDKQFLIGLPQMTAPVPFAGALTIPEIALFKERDRRGVVKIGATAIRRDGGNYVDSATTRGGSRKTEYALLLLITWTKSDPR